jgi:hypothetical protein
MNLLTESEVRVLHDFNDRVKQTELRFKDQIPYKESNSFQDPKSAYSTGGQTYSMKTESFQAKSLAPIDYRPERQLRTIIFNGTPREASDSKLGGHSDRGISDFRKEYAPKREDSKTILKLIPTDSRLNTSLPLDERPTKSNYDYFHGDRNKEKDKKVSFDERSRERPSTGSERRTLEGLTPGSYVNMKLSDIYNGPAKKIPETRPSVTKNPGKENVFSDQLDQYLKNDTFSKPKSQEIKIRPVTSDIPQQYSRYSPDSMLPSNRAETLDSRSRLTVPSIRSFEQERLDTRSSKNHSQRRSSVPRENHSRSIDNDSRDKYRSQYYDKQKQFLQTSPSRYDIDSRYKSENNQYKNPRGNLDKILLVQDYYQSSPRHVSSTELGARVSPKSMPKPNLARKPESAASSVKTGGHEHLAKGASSGIERPQNKRLASKERRSQREHKQKNSFRSKSQSRERVPPERYREKEKSMERVKSQSILAPNDTAALAKEVVRRIKLGTLENTKLLAILDEEMFFSTRFLRNIQQLLKISS